MLILCDGQDLVDGPGLDVFECVRFLGCEDVGGLEDRYEDLLPRARQLVDVLRLRERQSLELRIFFFKSSSKSGIWDSIHISAKAEV